MTKKKRGHPDIEEVLARPWCYYCERDFDDLKILISHQKARHFKCDRCGRRLNTAGGLSVHMNQVHKETLTAVENALPNRADLNVEIFGMEGIPDDVVQQHNQRVITQFHQAEAERRASTGNPGPGGSSSNPGNKKAKLETPNELKKRLAEHKAKKLQEIAGGESGSATPVASGQGFQSPGSSQSPNPFQAASAQYSHQQPLYPPQGSPPPPFQHPFAQPGYAMPQQQPVFPQQPLFSPGPPGFSPSGQPFLNMPQYPPQTFASQQFPQPISQQFPPHQQPLGAGLPPSLPFQQQHHPPPPLSVSPMQNGSYTRPAGLPPAPGLPQRPAFGAPPVNSLQMQQMHQGHVPGPPTSGQQPGFTASADPRIRNGATGSMHHGKPSSEEEPSATAADVDELIANAAKESETSTDAKKPHVLDESTIDKKLKKEKDKDKETKLVYSDNEVSPEEKMAALPRYAFDPKLRKGMTAMADASHAAVTGVVTGPEDTADYQQ